jgi:hypothetical protein
MVGARGFEPPTTCTPCRYATRLRYAPTNPDYNPASAQRFLPRWKFPMKILTAKTLVFFLVSILPSLIVPSLLITIINASEASAATPKSTRPDNGAIAFHMDSRSYGFAVDRRTSREARVEALKQCGHEKCEVVLTLKNGCGALAAGSKTYFVSRGATREEAQTKATRQCGRQCEILAWACTK